MIVECQGIIIKCEKQSAISIEMHENLIKIALTIIWPRFIQSVNLFISFLNPFSMFALQINVLVEYVLGEPSIPCQISALQTDYYYYVFTTGLQ